MSRTTIILDPGHGGDDPGACRESPPWVQEKRINLRMAGLVVDLLGLIDPDCRVVMTRVNDVAVGLTARAALANELDAACLVSIHCNSFTDPQARGREIWTKAGCEQSVRLAHLIRSQVQHIPTDLVDRGIKPATFTVLSECKSPAVLIELGFISNEEEARILMDETYQLRYALAIAVGIYLWMCEEG